MKRALIGLLLAAGVAAPLGALAQNAPPMPPPGAPGQMAPSPEMRAAMDRIRSDAKAASFGALSPDHRALVQALTAQVAAGTLTPRDGASQIDAALTPDESKAVLAAASKSRDAMHAAFAANAPAGAPAGPPADHPNGPPGAMGEHRAPSAGRFLLMVSMTPDQMRAWHDRRMEQGTPAAH